MTKYKKIVIAVDQSYTRSGIAIAADGKIKIAVAADFKGLKTKTEKRKYIYTYVYNAIYNLKGKAEEIIVLVERIRTFSQGESKNKGFGLNPNYLKATGALIATIVDAAFEHGIEVYSVDTRSWKSKIVGTTKGGKQPTIDFVKNIGIDVSYKDTKGNTKYNDDIADAVCIALYGFLDNKLIKKED